MTDKQYKNLRRAGIDVEGDRIARGGSVKRGRRTRSRITATELIGHLVMGLAWLVIVYLVLQPYMEALSR